MNKVSNVTDIQNGMKTFSAAHILQDLCGLLDVQTLEDLVAKLEFENELKRVCSRFLQSKNQGHGKNTESLKSDVKEGSTGRWDHDSKEEYSFLLDMILEIERDNALNNLYVILLFILKETTPFRKYELLNIFGCLESGTFV